MPVIKRDGVDIFYEVHGEGPAILLSHGFSATSRMWSGQVAALSQQHTLITWDFRGHGRSGSPPSLDRYSEALTTADMAAILAAAGFSHAIVGGLSLGGYMSLAFFNDYPEMVRALLIIDTGPGFKSDEARAQWNAFAEESAVAIADNGLASTSPEQVSSDHQDLQGVVRAGRTMLKQHSNRVITSLPAINVPTLIVVGENDTGFLAGSDYMAAKIPDAEKVVLKDAGHAANIDQPEAFNHAVMNFIKRRGL